jgi:RNA polymerase sigma-70 factor (ECF subfamily)
MNPLPDDVAGTSLENAEDEELLRLARGAPEGDLRPFEQLVLRYQKKVVANCRYITHDPNNAEDLAQEVMVKVFFALPSFEGKSTFRYWLQRVKVNHCLNYLKKQEGKSFVAVDEPESEGISELTVDANAEKEAVVIGAREIIGRVLDSMSKNLRLPLVLCDMDELSYEKVARLLGISLSAVKMRIKRAREEFRARYVSLEAASAANVQQAAQAGRG